MYSYKLYVFFEQGGECGTTNFIRVPALMTGLSLKLVSSIISHIITQIDQQLRQTSLCRGVIP